MVTDLVQISIVILVVATLATGVSLPVVIRLLRKFSVFDVPSHRSSHTVPTPRGAGIALTIGVAAAWPFTGTSALAVFVFVIAMSLIGFVDDLRSRAASLRLVLQIVLALGVSRALVSDGQLQIFMLLTLVCVTGWLVGTVNVVNFMDGINGVTAVHGVIVGVAYWILLAETQNYWSQFAAALVGASVAFLPWNWGKRARAFLGDAGSYLLGAGFGVLAVGVWQSGYGIFAAMAPVSIYWVDVVFTLVRRVWRRESPMSAHREHVYQRILKPGRSHSSVTLVVACFSSIACAIAILEHLGLVRLAIAWVILLVLCLVYLCLPAATRRWQPLSNFRTRS